MLTDRERIDRFAHYLVEKGYAPESISREYHVGPWRLDIVVIDPLLNYPSAVFEVIPAGDEAIFNKKWQQMLEWKKQSVILKDAAASLFLVVDDDKEKQYRIFRVFERQDEDPQGKVSEIVHEESPPPYSGVLTESRSKSLQKTKEKQAQTYDKFRILCWGMAGVIFLLFLLYVLGMLQLDASALSLLGAGVALVIIPFASKLKILGVEFERLTHSKSKEGG